ncbi:hypothetical protein BDQ17DRAFT_1357686 [Cyathus striatus]|nr:hypothetical protein BDQ17DRAFT_1357686 [Cyathus striatus]
MAARTTRSSANEETTPLLTDPEAEGVERPAHSGSSLSARINAAAQEPLTPLSAVLLIIALVLLLLSSVFIGLFAGAQHKLNLEREHHGDKPPAVTTTIVTTATSLSTATATTTEIATTTSTTVSTTTASSAPVPAPTSPPLEKPCFEPHCIILSASILSSIDITYDPCENFYEFANAGWLKSNPLPADKSSYGQFEALAQNNKHVIQSFLETNISETYDSSADQQLLEKLRALYASCVNEDQLEDIGDAPLKQFVHTVRSLFREDADAISSNGLPMNVSGLTAALAFLHSRGIESLFNFGIEGDVGVDPNHMILWFSQSNFALPSKEYYNEKSILKTYRNVIERLLLILDENETAAIPPPNPIVVNDDKHSVWPTWPWPPWGDDKDGDGDDDKNPTNRTKVIYKLAKDIVAFERELANASLDLDILYQDPIATYNPVSLRNLTEALPQFDFPAYFSAFTPRSYPDRVIMTYPSYAFNLSKILNDSKPEVIEGYLVVRAALSLSEHLGMSTQAWQAQRQLLELLSGIKKGAVGDRSEYCIGKVEDALGFASGRFFVNETFGGESKEKGTKVIADIINAFKSSLTHINWMDKPSSKAAAEKADAIRVKVGYPLYPDTRQPESISRYYSGVKIDKVNFFDNMISAATDGKFKEWLQLGRQRNNESWEMYPSTVNAYFNPPANEIVFPAGILQPPFFSQKWPGYLSYGAFGHVAAHELTHAFDSAGRLYNQEGKLEEWWTNFTSKGFQGKQDCIVKQYSAYTIDDGKGGKVYVNGNLTSGENIGDTGLIQAYRAWKTQYRASLAAGTEYLLPGLQFSREQLFFISFARIWARAMKPAAAVQRIRTDPHSPSEYRVDGTVYNIPEFAEAFQCKKGAKLNPPREKQCVFWS